MSFSHVGFKNCLAVISQGYALLTAKLFVGCCVLPGVLTAYGLSGLSGLSSLHQAETLPVDMWTLDAFSSCW